MPNFNGTYSLSGTYTGRSGNSVHGSLVITNQTNNTATATAALTMTDNGNVFFALNTPDPGVRAVSGPVQATVGTNGSFSLQFTGREVITGIDPAACCTYVLDLQGSLSGGRIAGTWTLTRPDMPSSDSGTFAATR